jgi:hypothetical protein
MSGTSGGLHATWLPLSPPELELAAARAPSSLPWRVAALLRCHQRAALPPPDAGKE